MTHSAVSIPVYLEIGSKRTIAGALAWPGWTRSGRDADAALAALRDYAPRYAKVVRAVGLDFPEVTPETDFTVAERLEGNATTDFGAPAVAPARDAEPLTDGEIARLRAILEACWRSLDEAVAAAQGKELRKGPRGGGRDLAKIVEHVMGAEHGYLASVGGSPLRPDAASANRALAQTREAILDALVASAAGALPTTGPRGGKRWSPRYFVRRVAWHALDHAWEIEDRVQPP